MDERNSKTQKKKALEAIYSKDIIKVIYRNNMHMVRSFSQQRERKHIFFLKSLIMVLITAPSEKRKSIALVEVDC